MPDPNSNNDSISAANIDVAVYLEAKNQEYIYDSLPTICYICSMSVMGLVGNSVVFMVYYKRYQASCAMRFFVLVMCLTDLLTNAQILLADLLEIRFYATFRWGWACKIFRFTRSCLVGSSLLLLVAVAVDRKQAVCNEQVVSNQGSYKRLYVPVGSCLVWAMLLSLPYGIITGYRTLEFTDNLNITGVTCTISNDFAGTKIPLLYNMVLFLAFLILVCIMGVSYGRILLHLWHHKKKLERWPVKAEVNADHNNEVATTPNEVATKPNKVATKPKNVATKPKAKIQKGHTMMFAVLTLVFVVSNMPYLTVVILEDLRPGLVETALTINGMMICLRSFYINSAVNPIVYSFCSPRFRFECRQFFARCALVGRLLAIRD